MPASSVPRHDPTWFFQSRYITDQLLYRTCSYIRARLETNTRLISHHETRYLGGEGYFGTPRDIYVVKNISVPLRYLSAICFPSFKSFNVSMSPRYDQHLRVQAQRGMNTYDPIRNQFNIYLTQVTNYPGWPDSYEQSLKVTLRRYSTVYDLRLTAI